MTKREPYRETRWLVFGLADFGDGEAEYLLKNCNTRAEARSFARAGRDEGFGIARVVKAELLEVGR